MKRWAIVLSCVLSLVACASLAACASDDGEGGGSAGSAGTSSGAAAANGAAAGGGSGGSAGSAGAGAGSAGAAGVSSTAGAGGSVAGAGAAGTVAGAGSSGTGGSAGGAAGVSGAGESGEGGSGGQSCGVRGLMECPPGWYCSFPESADCGRADEPGTCIALTDVACGEIYAPVCGCDGETYGNACSAMQAGVSVDHDGECGTPEGGYDCVLSSIACFIAIPQCIEGQVPSADGACFGPCVPIEECKCGGPDDCPFPEKYTCWMSAGHCGPYTQ